MQVQVSGPPQWRGGIVLRPDGGESLFPLHPACHRRVQPVVHPNWTMRAHSSGPPQWRGGIVLRPAAGEPLFLQAPASPWRAQSVEHPSCTMRAHSSGPPQWRGGIVPRIVGGESLFPLHSASPWRVQPAERPRWSIRLHFALSAESVPGMSCLHQGVAVVHRGFYLSAPLTWRRTMPRRKVHCRFWGIHSG